MYFYKGIVVLLAAATCLTTPAFGDSLSLTESWKDSSDNNANVTSKDTGTLTASFTVPGLSSLTANDWSNLLVSVTMTPFQGSYFTGDFMANAPSTGGSVSPTSATFFIQGSDSLGNFVNIEKIIFSRSGDTLTISDQTINPTGFQPPVSLLAGFYVNVEGPIADSQTFEVSLSGSLDNGGDFSVDISKKLNITGTCAITTDSFGNFLNTVQITGSASFTAPTVTSVAPAGSATVTNGLLTVQVKATSSTSVANVEFYWNGVDYGPGNFTGADLWSQFFALVPGANSLQTQATDAEGNTSPINSINITYVNRQTNAAVVQFSEHYQDVAQSDGFGGTAYAFTQDAGVLNAAISVPGLQAMTLNTWSNLVLALSFGDLTFSNRLAEADVLSSTSATFYVSDFDLNGDPINIEQFTVTRSGNTLVIFKRTGNPTYASNVNGPIIAYSYYGTGTPVKDKQPFRLTLSDGNTQAPYANFSQVVYITGTATTNHDSNGIELDNIQITGQADFTPPTVQVLTPVSGQLWSNSVFTVTGKSSDNILVTNVFYSVNGSSWQSPATANNWTNWTTQMNLIPGTNTFLAYAVDSNGNISTTNKVNLVYILSAPLIVNQIGLGTLSPNYNGSLLPLGQNFSMKATAAGGFQFVGWSGSLSTNGATLMFTMASNLTFTATFIDTNRPTVTITTPTSGQLWSNSVFTMTGKSTDNVLVTNVFYSINSSDWQSANTGNNWSNWTAQVNLIPGTNSLAAYSVDSAGNISTTNKVNLVYVLSAPLVVNVVGSGTIAPNYNGTLLPLGRNFSMKATATTGFQFTGWSGSAATNGSTLVFTMASNLIFTATFIDTNRPTVTITTPTSGQLWSNSVFTVTGKATDNVSVANVFYSINNSDWVTADTANSWSNWTAQINLTPGTNIVTAYSVDVAGNVSVTNKANLVYILSAPLVVNVVGAGTVAPNYDGTLLALGKNFSMKATAAAGSRFTGWSGSLSTNGATLVFTMASNLMFTATFADTNRPTIAITNLASGQRVSNAVFIVKGRTTDNLLVNNVSYQLNGAGWSNAATANNWTNWSAPLDLIPGTNSLRTYATDSSGNISTTNSLNFFYVSSALLQIQMTGLGKISPNYSNALLAIGQNYSITSTPATGFVFTNWVISTNFAGGALSNQAVLKFMMSSNLTLQANFVDVTKPTLTITTPTADQKMSNALAALTGTAKDNWKVAGVWYQFNGGDWVTAPTTNNWTNWNQTLTLTAGTNIVKAYALDLGGNYSATNSVSFVSSNTFKLQLVFNPGNPLLTNGLVFSLQVSTNLSGHIQFSTNLTDWVNLATFKGTNSTLNFRDPAATNSPHRFYRATIP